MKTVIRFLIVVAVLATFVPQAVMAASPATAANRAQAGQLAQPAQDSNFCRAFPSRTTCDFQEVGVCENDAYTIATADAGGFYPVRGVVRYSPSCQSVWARGLNLNSLPYTVGAQITRSDGSFTKSIALYPNTVAKSKMLFVGPAGSFQACGRAIGSLELNNGVVINSAQTWCAYP